LTNTPSPLDSKRARLVKLIAAESVRTQERLQRAAHLRSDAREAFEPKAFAPDLTAIRRDVDALPESSLDALIERFDAPPGYVW
jgi:hypothetical protein